MNVRRQPFFQHVKNTSNLKYKMFRKQFHLDPKKIVSERFFQPSMTEPDNAMSIPEIISRYMRGHGIQVAVLPDVADLAASEDGVTIQDDPDMLDPFGVLPAESADPQPAPGNVQPDLNAD